jgi:hypothetical protein
MIAPKPYIVFELCVEVNPKVAILTVGYDVPYNYRYSSHLQVIECPNKRTSLLKNSIAELYLEEKQWKTHFYGTYSQ